MKRPYKVLSKQEIEDRRKGIGGSDARKLMEGKFYDLWRIKTGAIEEEDYSDVLWAQLGHFTEPFNAWWLESHYGVEVHYQADVSPAKVNEASPFLRCTPDGGFEVLTDRDGLGLPIGASGILELKHTNPFGHRLDPLNLYYPQCQHNLLVSGMHYCLLSVLYGNSGHEVFVIEADATYQGKLLEVEQRFWDYVQLDTPPDMELPDTPAPKAKNVARSRILKVKGANFEPQFKELEQAWMDTAMAAKIHDTATDALKALVPDDVSLLLGEKISIGVDKRGAKTVRAHTKKDKEIAGEN